MLERFSRREKILLLVGLLLVFIGLYYFFLYQPLAREISSLEEEKQRLELEYEQSLNLVTELPELEEELESLQKQAGEADTTARVESPEEILGFLAEGVSEEEVKLNSYYPESGEDGLYINLEIEGSYHALLDFILRTYSWNSRLAVESMYAHNSEDSLEIELELFFENFN